jgi:uncharacterized protein with GYD domain
MKKHANRNGEKNMLFVIEVSWKPEKSDEFWKRVEERKVPQSEGVKIIGAYTIPGQYRGIAIIESPNEKAVAQSTLNYEGVSWSRSFPAIPSSEYMKMRKELLK